MPRRDAREIAAIFAGGAVGALLRTGLSQAFPTGDAAWPWTTLAINVAGAFALGYFVTRLQERLPISAYRRPLLGTGFCGAFTTFSTVQIELLHLLDAHRYAAAAGYAATTIVAGYFAVVLATALVRRTRVIA
jgi:fluoride exporter